MVWFLKTTADDLKGSGCIMWCVQIKEVLWSKDIQCCADPEKDCVEHLLHTYFTLTPLVLYGVTTGTMEEHFSLHLCNGPVTLLCWSRLIDPITSAWCPPLGEKTFNSSSVCGGTQESTASSCRASAPRTVLFLSSDQLAAIAANTELSFSLK